MLHRGPSIHELTEAEPILALLPPPLEADASGDLRLRAAGRHGRVGQGEDSLSPYPMPDRAKMLMSFRLSLCRDERPFLHADVHAELES